MADLSALLADLVCGQDERAEAAALGLPGYGKTAFTALQGMLRSGHADTRWWAVRALAGWPKSNKLIRELVTALQDDSADVRQCAAMALGHYPDPQAVAALIQALSDPDLMTSQLASNALILIGAEAVPALIELLQTGTRTAKLKAVRALAETKDPRAIPALMKILGEDSSVMQYWAEHGLDKLGLGMVYIKPE
jgi:HEAT repeat protein